MNKKQKGGGGGSNARARTTGFRSLMRAGFSCSFLWTPARSPARTRPWMVSAFAGLGRPFWLPGTGISSLSCSPPCDSVCALARAACACEKEEETRKKGRRRGASRRVPNPSCCAVRFKNWIFFLFLDLFLFWFNFSLFLWSFIFGIYPGVFWLCSL